jgi:hypothetical protein
MSSWIHRIVMDMIEERGRRRGAPVVEFADKRISVPGDDIDVRYGCLFWWLLNISGFYLSLPADTYGIVIYPTGTSHNMEGGLHEAPPGLYKLQYVDKRERLDFTSPVSEITSDGEILTLKVIVRYRVIDPIIALQIDCPVETLFEHVESDVAQYIRTHAHNDIADSSENREGSKLLAFFTQRHSRRVPLSGALSITGIELKEFMGDTEYVEMRRGARILERKLSIEKDNVDRQKEVEKLKAEFKAEIDKITVRASAEKEVLQKEILHESRKRDIELENLRTQSKWRHELITKAVDAIGQALEPSGYPRNTSEIKTIIAELLAALKEDKLASEDDVLRDKTRTGTRPIILSPTDQKIEKLTNTLLNLLKPKK